MLRLDSTGRLTCEFLVVEGLACGSSCGFMEQSCCASAARKS